MLPSSLFHYLCSIIYGTDPRFSSFPSHNALFPQPLVFLLNILISPLLSKFVSRFPCPLYLPKSEDVKKPRLTYFMVILHHHSSIVFIVYQRIILKRQGKLHSLAAHKHSQTLLRKSTFQRIITRTLCLFSNISRDSICTA